MNCPGCKRELPDVATACRCGWVISGNKSRPRGYRQCEWKADGKCCLYPGSFSPNTHEGGPWYCALHDGCDSASYGASVVDASQDYHHPTEDEIMAAHNARAAASLKAQGLDRQPGETIAQWMKRTSEWMRGKGPKTFNDAAPPAEEDAA